MTSNSSSIKKVSRRIFFGAMLLSVIVLIAGFLASRKTETIKHTTSNKWLVEEIETLSSDLAYLEQLWKKNITETAKQESQVRNPSEAGEYARDIHGVRQISNIEGSKIIHHVTEFPVLNPEPQKPAFLIGYGDFTINRKTIFSDPRKKWLLKENHPPIFTYKINEFRAIVVLLDLEKAASIAGNELRKNLKKLPQKVPSGSLRQIIDNQGKTIFQDGKDSMSDQPSDETTYHPSIFGTWKIRYWHPRVTTTFYDSGLLVGSIFLASIITLAGWLLARFQQRTLYTASERVSFVNSVSHELRTPITNIMLSTDLLENEVLDNGKRRLKLIQQESQRLSRLVENVLTFARSESDKKIIPVTQEFSISELIENCLQNIEDLFKYKNITYALTLPLKGRIKQSPDEISQILFNLLSNIEKYTGEGAHVHIHSEIKNETLTIKVSDTGPGIPYSARGTIFEAFERVDNRANLGITGTGLGLFISRELARALGGDLSLLESEKGASFLLEIPIKELS